MYKILIIEDEVSLSEILRDQLRDEGLITYEAFNGEEGVNLFYETNPDLILLDINLPKKNGWEVCKEIRTSSNVPIIFMTARDSEIDEIRGLEIGGDDYITKPFNLKILLIKIKKLLKISDEIMYKNDGLELNFNNQKFKVDNELVDFSKKEAELLKYLVINRGKILKREIILNEIWGYEDDIEDRVVDTLIKRVRKKMENYKDLIKTIRGVGYTFDDK